MIKRLFHKIKYLLSWNISILHSKKCLEAIKNNCKVKKNKQMT